MTDQYKFELKNVKYAAFASEDSHCFEATLYKDGKRWCIVSDDGHGGCMDFNPLTRDHKYNELNAEVNEVNACLAL